MLGEVKALKVHQKVSGVCVCVCVCGGMCGGVLSDANIPSLEAH